MPSPSASPEGSFTCGVNDTAFAVLLAVLESGVVDVSVAVFVNVAPGPIRLTFATIVMVAWPLPASPGNVIVRALPLPPQTPPLVAAQETNVTAAGSVSVTVRFAAGSVLLLVTVIV